MLRAAGRRACGAFGERRSGAQWLNHPFVNGDLEKNGDFMGNMLFFTMEYIQVLVFRSFRLEYGKVVYR